LIRRTDLPPQLANDMCEWVSDALKSFIVTHYQMPPKAVQHSLTDAVRIVKSPPAEAKDQPADSAQKLIDKLSGSGQLKTGFLMRVLSQGQADLFDLAFSRLLEIELKRVPRGLLQWRRPCRGPVLPRRGHGSRGVRHRVQSFAPEPAHAFGIVQVRQRHSGFYLQRYDASGRDSRTEEHADRLIIFFPLRPSQLCRGARLTPARHGVATATSPAYALTRARGRQACVSSRNMLVSVP
jgi:hypothetical protein